MNWQHFFQLQFMVDFDFPWTFCSMIVLKLGQEDALKNGRYVALAI